MAKVTITESFKFSPNGHTIIEYPPGEHEMSDRAIECAKSRGIVKAKRAPANKATAAPKNKAT